MSIVYNVYVFFFIAVATKPKHQLSDFHANDEGRILLENQQDRHAWIEYGELRYSNTPTIYSPCDISLLGCLST